MSDVEPDLADWTRRLRHGHPVDLAAVDLDALDRHALDTSVGFAAEHARRYVASGGADDGWDGLRPIVILYAIGRRSGAWRRVPLFCFEHRGERHVIGSLGGAPAHPEWYLNVVADPAVHVRAGDRVEPATARILEGADRDEVFAALVAVHPRFAAYQARTDRQVPIVRLVHRATP